MFVVLTARGKMSLPSRKVE